MLLSLQTNLDHMLEDHCSSWYQYTLSFCFHSWHSPDHTCMLPQSHVSHYGKWPYHLQHQQVQDNLYSYHDITYVIITAVHMYIAWHNTDNAYRKSYEEIWSNAGQAIQACTYVCILQLCCSQIASYASYICTYMLLNRHITNSIIYIRIYNLNGVVHWSLYKRNYIFSI